MLALVRRLRYLFATPAGNLLTVTAWEALIVAFLSTFSAPLRALLGIPPADLPEALRVSRIIMVYHSLAVPFVAAVAYLTLDLVPVPAELAQSVRRIITPGYMLTSIGALGFAYFGRNWLLHGIFLLGLSLVFYAGVLLAAGLWPGRERLSSPDYAGWGNISLERLAFFVTAVALLISAVIGAGAGSFFGNGFRAVLAEDIVREEHNLGELAVIAHLHIMLALIDVAILLLIVRRFDLKGRLHKIAMPLTIAGTVVLSIGAWSVMLWEGIAHKIIYVGSTLLLFAALLMTIAGIGAVIRAHSAARGWHRPTAGQRLHALLADPLHFGPFFQMIWLQPVMVFPGLYTAVKLDEIYRAWPFEAERRILVGHWHILATLSATIMLLLVADRLRLAGRLRQWVGWGTIVGSDLAFAAGVVYEYLPPAADRTWAMPLLDAGLSVALLALAAFMVSRLIDLFRPQGQWAEELSES
ncbi:MAG: hypothetical protein H5T60_05915 [Anaerolineae bacterium]|nr:hypothetical protein [Anaerolineae bacterium]